VIRFVFFFREAQKKENDVARTSTINRVELRKKESKEATSSEAEKDRRRRKNQGGWSAATLDLQMKHEMFVVNARKRRRVLHDQTLQTYPLTRTLGHKRHVT